MQRFNYPGGWYCERLPGGKFIQGYPNKTVLTSEGLRTYIDDILMIRIGLVDNQIRFAGPGHNSFDIIEWDGTQFQPRGVNCGESPAAYWFDDRPDPLEIVRACTYPPYGSAGIRWIDTVIHPGADSILPVGNDGIFQWTERDGIKVGQGAIGGVAITYQGIRYILEEGNTVFVRFNKVGNNLAVAFWRQDINSGVHYEFTVDEISSLTKQPYPPPIPPMPPPAAPKVTIQSFEPKSGPIPLKVRAVAELSGGPADFLFWRADGKDVVKNPADDLDHTFTFNTSGKHNIGVRVEGPGGFDQTALPREVIAESPVPEPPGPDPIPIPPAAKKYWFKTIWQDYVFVNQDNIWEHGQESRTPFEVNDLGNNKVSIKAFKFTAAEPPTGLLISNRDTASDWERFTKGSNQFGTTFKADSTGKYIRAHDGVVFADAVNANDQEAFTLEEAKTDLSPVHVDKHLFRFPDNRRYYWAHVTAFSAFHDYITGDFAKLEVYAAWTLSVRANGWRVFGGWSRLNFDFRNIPDYFHQLDKFCQWMLEHGLRLEFTSITDFIPESRTEEQQFVNNCADVLRNYTHTFLEAANEVWKNATLLDSEFQVPSNVLFARGAAQTNDGVIPPIYTALPNGAAYSAYHSPRDQEFHRKGKDLKEIFDSFPGTHSPVVDNEPTRPDQQGFDLNKFWVAGCTRAMFGAGATFHGGADTLQLCNVPPAAEDTCAREFFNGLFAVPEDCPEWTYGRYGEAAPSTPHIIADQLKETGTGNALRVYEMTNGNHACAIAIDGIQPTPINGWRAVRFDGPNNCFVVLER